MSLLPGETAGTMKARIEQALPKGYNIDTPASRTRQIETLMGSFRNALGFISLMALFVGMYLIYNAVFISTVQRKKEIGILRALGARRGEIIRLFLGETLLFSILGTGLGVVFAEMTIGTVAQAVSKTYAKTPVAGLAFSWADLLRGAVVGVCVSLLAAAAPVLSISSISPISVIRSLPYSGDSLLFGRKIRIIALAFLALAALTFKAQDG